MSRLSTITSCCDARPHSAVAGVCPCVQSTLMAAFPDEYRAWVEDALAEGLPSDVVALTFNLFEQGANAARYGVELVGTSEFDRNKPDWACSEIWEPSNGRKTDIPRSFCDGPWDICLSQMREVIASFLREPSELSERLKAVRGIGIGFVDGTLLLLKTD